MHAEEIVFAKGHINVCAKHKSTFEITKEEHLSPKGDCIIAVASTKGCADLSGDFKKILASDNAVLKTKIVCGSFEFEITSRGSSKMTLTHQTDMVWRTSNFVCPRTVGILSDSASKDIPREIVDLLCKGEELKVILTVES